MPSRTSSHFKGYDNKSNLSTEGSGKDAAFAFRSRRSYNRHHQQQQHEEEDMVSALVEGEESMHHKATSENTENSVLKALRSISEIGKDLEAAEKASEHHEHSSYEKGVGRADDEIDRILANVKNDKDESLALLKEEEAHSLRLISPGGESSSSNATTSTAATSRHHRKHGKAALEQRGSGEDTKQKGIQHGLSDSNDPSPSISPGKSDKHDDANERLKDQQSNDDQPEDDAEEGGEEEEEGEDDEEEGGEMQSYTMNNNDNKKKDAPNEENPHHSATMTKKKKNAGENKVDNQEGSQDEDYENDGEEEEEKEEEEGDDDAAKNKQEEKEEEGGEEDHDDQVAVYDAMTPLDQGHHFHSMSRQELDEHMTKVLEELEKANEERHQQETVLENLIKEAKTLMEGRVDLEEVLSKAISESTKKICSHTFLRVAPRKSSNDAAFDAVLEAVQKSSKKTETADEDPSKSDHQQQREHHHHKQLRSKEEDTAAAASKKSSSTATKSSLDQNSSTRFHDLEADLNGLLNSTDELRSNESSTSPSSSSSSSSSSPAKNNNTRSGQSNQTSAHGTPTSQHPAHHRRASTAATVSHSSLQTTQKEKGRQTVRNGYSTNNTSISKDNARAAAKEPVAQFQSNGAESEEGMAASAIKVNSEMEDALQELSRYAPAI
eukprot:jgi/Bigna1/78856/fgenesh1_pg.57_\